MPCFQHSEFSVLSVAKSLIGWFLDFAILLAAHEFPLILAGTRVARSGLQIFFFNRLLALLFKWLGHLLTHALDSCCLLQAWRDWSFALQWRAPGCVAC